MAPSAKNPRKTAARPPHGLLNTMKSLRAGTSSLPPAVPNAIAGQPMTVAEIDQALDAGIALFEAVVNAHAATAATILTRDGENAILKLFCDNFVHYLRGALGKGNPQLAKFGLTTRAPQKPSASKTVKANVQRAATRKVRHVMGKKQRAEIPAASVDAPITVAADGTVTPAAEPPQSAAAAPGTKPPGTGSK